MDVLSRSLHLPADDNFIQYKPLENINLSAAENVYRNVWLFFLPIYSVATNPLLVINKNNNICMFSKLLIKFENYFQLQKKVQIEKERVQHGKSKPRN